MQNVAIELIDENGNVLEESTSNFAEIGSFLCTQPDFQKVYPWLSTIDPHGDTVFNTLQVPHLTKELTQLGTKIDVGAVVEFLNKIDTHQYIKFLGD